MRVAGPKFMNDGDLSSSTSIASVRSLVTHHLDVLPHADHVRTIFIGPGLLTDLIAQTLNSMFFPL